jgi:hypothetical protein
LSTSARISAIAPADGQSNLRRDRAQEVTNRYDVGVRVEELDPLHRAAVGAALGFLSPFESIYSAAFEGREADPLNVGDLIFKMLRGENDLDADIPAHAIEELAKRRDPDFVMSAPSSAAIARSFVETECLFLLSGSGSPARLLRALRQADRIFGNPEWVGPFFRNIYARRALDAAQTPGFVDQLRALADRVSS